MSRTLIRYIYNQLVCSFDSSYIVFGLLLLSESQSSAAAFEGFAKCFINNCLGSATSYSRSYAVEIMCVIFLSSFMGSLFYSCSAECPVKFSSVGLVSRAHLIEAVLWHACGADFGRS